MNNTTEKMFKAIASNNVTIVKSLLQQGASANMVDAEGEPALIRACEMCETGNAEMIKLLLSHGADINTRGSDGETPLILAAASSADIADMLILNTPGANPHLYAHNNIGPLFAASLSGFTYTVHLLIDRHADPNIDSILGTPLLMAAAQGHSEVVKLLISGGAVVDRFSSLSKDLGSGLT